MFNYGDRVYYKRDQHEDWLGPAKVIFQDGKVVYVRHGFDWVKVSPNKLVKSGKEFDTSGDSIVMVSPDKQTTVTATTQNNDDSDDDTAETERTGEIGIPPVQDHTDQVETHVQNPAQGHIETQHKNSVDSTATKTTEPRRSLRQFNSQTGAKLYSNEDPVVESTYVTLVPDNLKKSQQCTTAKLEEIQKLQNFDAYEVVPDDGQERISTRWVLTMKNDKVKARLVARGFEEMSEVQSDSPTISKCGMRVCLMLGACSSWNIKSTDIKSAFLQSNEMQRAVYLRPPKEADDTGSLWRLKKCLYGLSDASRQFYLSINTELIDKLGCEKSEIDPSLFFRRDKAGNVCGILVSHIDDFLHCGTAGFQEHVVDKLTKRFIAGKQENKDFLYVGYQVIESDDGIKLNQTEYIQSIDTHQVPDARSARKTDSLSTTEKTMLRSMVGSLNWAVQGSRPDAAFEMIDLSTKFNNGTVGDLDRAYKTVRKIKEQEINILYPCLGKPENWKLVVFSDASFANLSDGVSSSMAYIIFMVGEDLRCCPLVWRACKISRVVRSTLAAETMALQEAVEEVICVRQMMKQLLPKYDFPVKCLVDNDSLVQHLYSTLNSTEEKSLRINIASLKQAISRKNIESVSWVETKEQLADCMTKRGANCAKLLTVLQSGRLPENIYDL